MIIVSDSQTWNFLHFEARFRDTDAGNRNALGNRYGHEKSPLRSLKHTEGLDTSPHFSRWKMTGRLTVTVEASNTGLGPAQKPAEIWIKVIGLSTDNSGLAGVSTLVST